MALYLYNTLARRKELFKPINPDEVGIYNCGPTVYWYAHIGNLRTYIFEDILRRVLEYNNYKTKEVMNITDVGHLTSDTDEGEDKIIKAARKEKKTALEIAQFYTDAFKNDLRALNILKPHIWCKATDNIQEQIDLIKRLEQKDYAYKAGDNVYFNTVKSPDYGKIANLTEQRERRTRPPIRRPRVEKDPNKKNPNDFVLWFTKSKFDEQEMQWDSPWGVGYPGWHLECSAMSIKYLGEHFDIHCGGIDHIGVHHTNEIAQSEAATGHKFVNYWMHGEFLKFKDEKISKSAGTIIRVDDIIKKGFNPLAFRYLCLTAHYRTPLNFSWEALQSAQNALDNLYNLFRHAEFISTSVTNGSRNEFGMTSFIKNYKNLFLSTINDDLNMPQALAVVWDLIKDQSVSAEEKKELLLDFDRVLGLGLINIKPIEIPEKIQKLVRERAKAREDKNWTRADELRKQINELGYEIEDTPKGSVINII